MSPIPRRFFSPSFSFFYLPPVNEASSCPTQRRLGASQYLGKELKLLLLLYFLPLLSPSTFFSYYSFLLLLPPSSSLLPLLALYVYVEASFFCSLSPACFILLTRLYCLYPLMLRYYCIFVFSIEQKEREE